MGPSDRFMLRRCAVLASCCCLLFAIACKTTDTTVRVEKTKEGLNNNDALFDKSNLTPEEKAEGKKNNENARVLITDQNTKIQTQTKEIERLEWYEDIFWQVAMAIGGIAVGVILSKVFKFW